MFVGHYGPTFAIKGIQPAIPLWLLFIAVQLVDVAWAALVLLEIEKVRIVPGITASNPLDLYYMSYTHSLVAVALWAVAAIVLCKPLRGVRQAVYRHLFRHHLDEEMVSELRLAINQNQSLGNERFYETIECMAGQRREARPHGRRLSGNVAKKNVKARVGRKPRRGVPPNE